MGTLTPLDLVVFVGSLLAVMLIGLYAGRKENTSEDYYLAGKTTRWWGVAGSIFGSNVSANHIVGMMGVGFSVGSDNIGSYHEDMNDRLRQVMRSGGQFEVCQSRTRSWRSILTEDGAGRHAE